MPLNINLNIIKYYPPMERLNQLLKKYKIEIVCNNCGSPSSKIQKRKNKLGKRAAL